MGNQTNFSAPMCCCLKIKQIDSDLSPKVVTGSKLEAGTRGLASTNSNAQNCSRTNSEEPDFRQVNISLSQGLTNHALQYGYLQR